MIEQLRGFALFCGIIFAFSAVDASDRSKIFVVSSIDQTKQPSYVILPDGYAEDDAKRPLLVSLHTWSGDLEQRNATLEQEANSRGWIYLFPNFRGRNDHPEACGSKLAQQDILDAVAHAQRTYRVDPKRVYLTGVSGGGHMTMLMAGRHPDVWTAASAWVGISDLAAWHRKHEKGRYGEMCRKSCGGAPGDSSMVDREFSARSPLSFLAKARNLPLDIAAGIHDGHKGSVPIRHSLEAFNVIAKARGDEVVAESEINSLSKPRDAISSDPKSERWDKTFGREIHFRRKTGPVRVSIFEGGHEGISRAAVAWLAKHRRAPGESQ